MASGKGNPCQILPSRRPHDASGRAKRGAFLILGEVLRGGGRAAARCAACLPDDLERIPDQIEIRFAQFLRHLQGQPQRKPFGVAACADPHIIEEMNRAAHDHGNLHRARVGPAAAIEVYLHPPPLHRAAPLLATPAPLWPVGGTMREVDCCSNQSMGAGARARGGISSRLGRGE